MASIADWPQCLRGIPIEALPVLQFWTEWSQVTAGTQYIGPWLPLFFSPSFLLSSWSIHLSFLGRHLSSTSYPRDPVLHPSLFSLDVLLHLDALFHSFDCKAILLTTLNLFPGLSLELLTHIIKWLPQCLYSHVPKAPKIQYVQNCLYSFLPPPYQILPHSTVTYPGISLKCPMLKNYSSFPLFSHFPSKLWSP